MSDWLERLDECLRSDSSIGRISPLSNNATILSVPIMNTNNKLPESVMPDIFAEKHLVVPKKNIQTSLQP